MLELKRLTPSDGEDVYKMLQEIPKEENGFINSANGKSFPEYREWLKNAAKNAEQLGIIDGWRVPETFFWLYDGLKPVGFGKIRHFLTDALRTAGGNIGYAIRPDERRKGYGKAILGLLLKEAREMGVDEILVTVYEDNTVSLKIALANGGKIEKTENGRFYITI